MYVCADSLSPGATIRRGSRRGKVLSVGPSDPPFPATGAHRNVFAMVAVQLDDGDAPLRIFANTRIEVLEEAPDMAADEPDVADERVLRLVPLLGQDPRRRLLQLEEGPLRSGPLDRPLAEAGLCLVYRTQRARENDQGKLEQEPEDWSELTPLGWVAVEVLRKKNRGEQDD